VRILGVSVYDPLDALSDLAALERLVRSLPAQIERGLVLGEQLVDIGQRVLVIAERLDRRATSIDELGERLDAHAVQLLTLGEGMGELGGQIDATGAEIVTQAAHLVSSASELITLLPTLERAIELASPLEGAIDRFGRIVDRFPGRRPPEPPGLD
jgi:hypothetical protein